MKIKTQNLTGEALDWAVQKILFARQDYTKPWILERHAAGDPCGSASTDWAQGGPIIEREGIETAPRYADDGKTITGWTAMMFNDARNPRPLIVQHGDSLLVAAMRCVRLAYLGEEVELPEGLKND